MGDEESEPDVKLCQYAVVAGRHASDEGVSAVVAYIQQHADGAPVVVERMTNTEVSISFQDGIVYWCSWYSDASDEGSADDIP